MSPRASTIRRRRSRSALSAAARETQRPRGRRSRRQFDIALRFGEDREDALAAVLTGATIEVKTQLASRTHVFVNSSTHGKPSGISVTTADYWALEVDPGVWILLPTSTLKAIYARAISDFGLKAGGDGNKGATIPKRWLIGLEARR